MKIIHIATIGFCILAAGCSTPRQRYMSARTPMTAEQQADARRGMDYGIIVAGEKICGYKYNQAKLNAILGKKFKELYGPFRAGFTTAKSATLTYYQGNTAANKRDICKNVYQRAKKHGII